MAAREVLALNETTPQILAPQSGDTYSMPRPVAISAGTLTTDVKVLDLSATWNAAGVTFTGLKFNVTNTASAAASLLMDLQVGGTSVVKIRKDGFFRIQSAHTSTSYMGFTSSSGLNNRLMVSNETGAIAGAFDVTGGAANGFHVEGVLGFSSNVNITTSDVVLVRDAANTLALRNSTNAQTFRSYRTYTDGSNYQRLSLGWNTSTAVIHNEGAGTGADGNIAFNDAALATNATKGYVMIPSCAGAPTGVPADIPTGQVALHFDSTNNKIYVYDGGWISTAALT